MNNIPLKYLKVSQPIGEFYCCVMSARELHKISYSDIRSLNQEQSSEDGIDTYLGIQRELNKSRVKKIREYVSSVDATFPNSIIISVKGKYVTIENGIFNIDYEKDQEGKIAKILDGQHRLAGFDESRFEFNKDDQGPSDFELLVTIFVEADLHTQAQVFTMVNQNQTKVNKSLVYDLESLALARSPYKTAHQVAVLLNSRESSPFFRRIKRLGVKTYGIENELLTQAAFVDNLIKLISKKASLDRDILLGKVKRFLGIKNTTMPDQTKQDFSRFIFRKNFLESDDASIAANIHNYYSAIERKWPSSWSKHNKSSVLNKTVGLIATMRFLRDVYNQYIAENNSKLGVVITSDEYFTILSSIHLEESFFAEVEAISKTSGLIYKTMKEKISNTSPL